MLDERTRAAIARLTPNERECLARRLGGQTAKEMAIELGISPHAVEKRLKMARAKLGVSSSRQAARMAAEAYQQPGAASPDLDPAPFLSNPGPDGGRTRRAFPWIFGGTAMSIAIAALLSTGQPQDAAAAGTARAYAASAFDTIDRDGSGFIEAAETANVRVPAPEGTTAPASWLAGYDMDKDGRVSREEFVAVAAPAILRDQGDASGTRQRTAKPG